MAERKFTLLHRYRSLFKRQKQQRKREYTYATVLPIFRFFTLAFITALLCISTLPALANFSDNNFLNPQSLISSSSAPKTSLLQQGKILYNSGKFAESVQVLQQAVQEYQQQGDTLRLAVSLSDLSLANQQLGAWTEAKQAIAQSLILLGYQQHDKEGTRYVQFFRKWRKLSANTHDKILLLRVLGQSLEIQGRLQLLTGKAEEALSTWQETADIYNRAQDKNGIARSLINQAQALLSSGFYRRAKAVLEDVNQILRSQSDSIEKATALRSLGNVLQHMGELEHAGNVLQQSLEISQRLQSPIDISATLFSLGNNARSQQKTQQAITFYQQTVKVSPSLLLKVQAQLNHLSLLIEEQQWADAQTLLPSIQSQLDQLPPSHAGVYARINFAQSLLKKVRNEELGIGNGEISSTPLISPARILATAVEQARSLGDKRAEAYALGSLGSVYEQSGQLSEAKNLTEQALSLAQVSNATDIAYLWQWQLGRLLKAQKDFKGAIAAYDIAIDNLQSLRSDLVAINQDVQFTFRDSVEPIYRQSVELLLQGQPDAKTLEKARQRIESLQLAELENFLQQPCLQDNRVLLDQVVDRDNPTTAILYPIILPNELQVIVKIFKRPLFNYTTKIPQAQVEETVIQLRQNLTKPYAINILKTQSQQIYNWLIKPVESQLQASKVKTLVFILDGVLKDLPPSALYDGRQYLVEKYAIALSVGLRIFDPKPLEKQQLRALTAGLTQPPLQFSYLTPLRAIKTELNLIAKAGIPTTSLLDQQFTKSALEKKVQAVSFNILHLATHGEFSSKAKGTFILAADGPIYVSDFDKILRSQDETRSQAVQLLVLSACQTAAGDNHAILGLAGAAVRAGARSTVASLWEIDDEATAIFVGAFYRSLKVANTSKAEALRYAQRQLLKHPNYNAPNYWSTYVLIGNWF